MVDRTLMREIKKLTGDGSRDAKFALLHKVDAAAKDLADHPRDRFDECIKTHGRAVVAICLASTIYERRDRLDRWQFKWAQEVLDILPGWTEGNRRRAYIDDWEMHPTAICDYAGKTIRLWTEHERRTTMEKGKIKYASAEFTPRGEVKEGTVTWHTGTMFSAIESTKAAGGKLCALFFYGDVKDLFAGRTFFDDTMNATREEFEPDPARYGLCYYKQPFTGGTWVYE